MNAVGEYIFSVASTALICGILCSLLKDCGIQGIVKLICGLVLTLAVLRPVSRLHGIDLSQIVFPDSMTGEYAVSEGKQAAQNAMADIIKQEAEAYILDKAAELGLELTVQVTLDGGYPPTPVSVELSGEASPYLKLRLEERIQEDLNIPKENQLWIG